MLLQGKYEGEDSHPPYLWNIQIYMELLLGQFVYGSILKHRSE